MKKSKIKKLQTIVKDILKENIHYTSDNKQKFNKYNKTVSDKTKQLIIDIMNYKEAFGVNYSTNTIVFYSNDITQIKTTGQKTTNTPQNDDNFLEIAIEKNKGFSIQIGFKKRANYKDKSFYELMKPIIDKTINQVNKENFEEIYQEVIQKSGLIRQSNLKQLLN